MPFPLGGEPTPRHCDRTGAYPGEWVGYLYTDANIVLNIGATITATGSITSTGTPVFDYVSNPDNTCVSPATWRIWFMGTSSDGDGRWWYDPSPLILAPGTFNLAATVAYSNWSNAFGVAAGQDASSMALFDQARTSVYQIGGTFGGGCFFGHGVNMSSGTANFALQTYSVQ